ncbi:mechanosensitive ion channel family protein [Iodobacter sp. CM08]|uniref:mechanosensitive ion channel family protein n=1 Tax=Iodobacter sp. CM08 TaxID=3085902 RepID=UPI002980DE82|nr:mechanosensitive ion channel family protein [Iodobacter sp. CM08]MDW5416595.1 mechanosensitive ion channel family protein [Iodobacter sp. CM08]
MNGFTPPSDLQLQIYFLLISLILGGLLYYRVRTSRRRLINTVLLLVFSGIGLYTSQQLTNYNLSSPAKALHETAMVILGFAIIRYWGMLLFQLIAPFCHLYPPRILEDLLEAIAMIGWVFYRLHLAGLELGQLVTTSAVITAVLAFAMQDTLGNILAGLALHLDNSIEQGDWIRLGELTGRVIDLSWRATRVETRNGETVMIPNGMLMKGQFQLLGKRVDKPLAWRRWIWFEVGLDTLPTQVMLLIETAIREAAPPNVAQDPPPSCLLMNVEKGNARYAARYWLTDLQNDDPTDSQIRTLIDAVLRRNSLRLAAPQYKVFVTQENERYFEGRHKQHTQERLAVLQKLELLASLKEEELQTLADKLRFTPYVAGDVMIRQGEKVEWLYIIIKGEAEAWVQPTRGERKLLAQLGPGSFFGEMGLMTGEAIRATVVVSSNVECYRIDKESFQHILLSRPELAGVFSEVLVKRQAEEQILLNDDNIIPPVARSEILAKLQHFIGLNRGV